MQNLLTRIHMSLLAVLGRTSLPWLALSTHLKQIYKIQAHMDISVTCSKVSLSLSLQYSNACQ